MFRILLIEDEVAFRNSLVESFSTIDGVEIRTAASRSSALSSIGSESFDLIVCDLKIPPNDGGLDTAEEHGFFVYETARELATGTCTYFLTGFANVQNTSDRLAQAPTVDVFGTGTQIPMVRLWTKEDMFAFVSEVLAFSEELKALDRVEVSSEETLTLDELRALRIFARRLGGSRVTVKSLGGLSGAHNMRATVDDEQDARRATVFCKLGEHSRIIHELGNYRNYVTPLLPIGSYPTFVDEVFAGAGLKAGVFYRLADDGSTDLFAAAAANPETAVEGLVQIEAHLKHWTENSRPRICPVSELRRERITDEQLAPYKDRLGSECEDLENVDVTLQEYLQHGDLHGANVLTGAGHAILIDFGDVRHAPPGYDPISMELSFLFHPDSPFVGPAWPTAEHVKAWFDVDAYSKSSPLPDVIRQCREWTLRASTSEHTIACIVYAHAVRMLKYPAVSKDLAISLARAAAAAASRSRA